MSERKTDTSNTITRQRRVRQEALREQLSSQKHVEHVIEMINKVSDDTKPLEKEMLDRFKVAIDAKMKLVNKYLPDLKQQEIALASTELTPEQWLDLLDEPDREAEEKEA